jgi:hypothetical protein
MNLPPRNLLRYTYETLHFVFHYTYTTQSAARTDRRYDASLPISAQHGIRNFTYVENYSAYFETSWRFYIDSPLGFSPPLGVSADKKYEVYIYQMDAYGVTFPERIFPNGTASSFIGVRNNYDGFGGNDDPAPEQGCMKVTAAHEFFHAVQFGIRLGGMNWQWWMEASATFMEDEVFDGVNDYRNYLTRWFRKPFLPLDTFDGSHEYGGIIFCKYLAERFGGATVIRDIWQRKTATSQLTAINSVLRSRHRKRLASANADDVFSSGFCISNLLPKEPLWGYEEGRNYPDIDIFDYHRSYPIAPVSLTLDHLTVAYILFEPEQPAQKFNLQVMLPGTRRTLYVRAAVVLFSDEAPPTVRLLEPRWDAGQQVHLSTLEAPHFTSEGNHIVALILANTTWGNSARDGVVASYSATTV